MVSNKGSRRRNLVALAFGAVLSLSMYKASTLLVTSANANERENIYCMNQLGGNSIGAVTRINNRLYRCAATAVLKKNNTIYTYSVAWVEMSKEEIHVDADGNEEE
ncbi:hypothetical protein LT85_p039 (plasmid) [Collimonas arenae]|uniref:Uncharacterized protein n=1 Tax=Collimonas arenae TaxID=279058 RepID=A0A0A1FHH6_9BURK|nr:hypothetical protein [Collimonas arenae]AIY44218.1 hypothetical protein LT85_p039 [Collimonas arenae]